MNVDTTKTMQARMGVREWALLVTCAMLWGGAYTFNKIVLPELPPLTITASRLAMAVTLLLPLALAYGYRPPPLGRAWRPFLVFTMLSNIVPFMLVLYGQRETASGLASVLVATTPLFLILLAHVYTRDEKLSANKLAGVLVGIAGVAVVFGSEALAGWSTALEAKLALVAASFLYAVGGVYAKRLTGYPPLLLATMQMTCGCLVATPLALAIDRPWTLPLPSWQALAALAGTGFLGSALAAVTYFSVFTRAGATNAMLVTLLVPITPIILGTIFFGETLLAREIAGAGVIALALLIIDGRLLSRRRNTA